MRRIGIFIIGLMAMSQVAFSQSRNELKGPQAKNYKVWLHSVETTDVQIIADQEEVKRGPQAKNKVNRLLAVDGAEEGTKVSTLNILNNERLGMVGPKAKNYKVGRK